MILAIDENYKRKITAEYPNLKNVFTLNEFAEDQTEIPDPYGKPLTAYGECFEILRELVKKLAAKLNSFAEGEV